MTTTFPLKPRRPRRVPAGPPSVCVSEDPAALNAVDLDEERRCAELCSLVGTSSAFTAVTAKIPAVSACDAGVLVVGETGTGKELVAHAVHYLSRRRSKPFVPVNCAALPVELVENELFGHERAAFTGATSSEPGLIAEAEGGTLFLDEVDSVPL